MYHAEEGFLAATMESLGLYVDLARRRVAPFPAAIRERLAAVFAADRDLPLPLEAGRKIAKPPLRQPRVEPLGKERVLFPLTMSASRGIQSGNRAVGVAGGYARYERVG